MTQRGMKIALVVPGGVDRSGERRVIPALLALLRRLSVLHEVHVFATHQEDEPSSWTVEGAHIHNLGLPRTCWRAATAIVAEHRVRSFDVIQSFWAGPHGVLAVAMGAFLRIPSIVHVAGGELAALKDISYGGCRTWRGRARERTVLRARPSLRARVSRSSTRSLGKVSARSVCRSASISYAGRFCTRAPRCRRACPARARGELERGQGSNDVAARAATARGQTVAGSSSMWSGRTRSAAESRRSPRSSGWRG